jgi:methyl-accepting chemotaxis protein
LNNRWKVTVAFALLAAAGYVTAIGTVSLLRESELLEHLNTAAEADLRSRVSELEAYSNSVMSDLRIIANAGLVQQAIGQFSVAYDQLGPVPTDVARQLYITDNPYPAKDKNSLVRANDGSTYSALHGLYHGWFRSIVDARDYFDLLLVRSDGTVIYSVAKDAETFGTNLSSGAYGGATMTKFVETVLKAGPDSTFSTGFMTFSSKGGARSEFVATPIYANGIVAGLLAIQVRLDPLQSAMGAGKPPIPGFTAYVVSDYGVNLTAPDAPVNAIAKEALAGGAGTKRTIGVDGREGFIAYAPLRWVERTRAVVTELDMDVADARKYAGVPLLTAIGALLVLLAGGLGWLLGAREP